VFIELFDERPRVSRFEVPTIIQRTSFNRCWIDNHSINKIEIQK